jgi:DNA-binding GntR family transcriptional regulator
MSQLEPRIRRQPSLANQVREAICEDIASGRLTRGERIVLERLAERLGVSPTPVREAVARLVQDRLIIEMPDGRLQIVPLTREYVLDIFLVRAALEGLAAELAAARLTAADLARLKQSMQSATAGLAGGDFDAYMASDALLHDSMRTAPSSPTLTQELQSLQAHVAYIRAYSQRHVGDHLRMSHDEHRTVVDALASRDAAAARQAMESHIRRAGERIVQLIAFEERPT